MRWLKESKYHNKWVEVDGIKFPSIKEAERWKTLRLMERAGDIVGLNRQVKIELVPKSNLFRAVYYVADFVYFDKRTGKTVYEDVKGYKGGSAYQLFTLKKKILYWRHGIEVLEV